MRLTFGQAKQTFAPFINNGVCADNPEVPGVLNSVCERLFETGKFVGMVRRIAICHSSSCLTLPYNVESILEMSGQCGQPVNVRNQWYEYLPGGPWQLDRCNRFCNETVPRDNSPTAFDICGIQYLRVYANLPEEDGAQILIQGYDENGARVRTLVDGIWVDGEYIGLINGTPQLSTKLWTRIENVIKPLTNGEVNIYMVDPANTAANAGLIAIYQPNETNPSYQRFHMSGFCASAEHPKHVTMLVKMKFVPMVRDSDMLPITSYNAMMFACQAMYFWGSEQFDKAQVMELKANGCLQDELKQALGGQSSPPRVKFAGMRDRPLSWQMR
jgi:hypothetical protein